jgi:hypothetical protein
MRSGTITCGKCGKEGHNRRSCGKTPAGAIPAAPAAPAAPPRPKNVESMGLPLDALIAAAESMDSRTRLDSPGALDELLDRARRLSG